MIDPVEADIGRWVVYHHDGMEQDLAGIITSFDSSFVFVQYGPERNPQPTDRQHLTWVLNGAVVNIIPGYGHDT